MARRARFRDPWRDGSHQPALTQRVKQLAERYGNAVPQAASKVAVLQQAVYRHLKLMGLHGERPGYKQTELGCFPRIGKSFRFVQLAVRFAMAHILLHATLPRHPFYQCWNINANEFD